MHELRSENLIVQYGHCGVCLHNKPPHYSPMEWQDISVGLTEDMQHIQIWCNRHNVEVALLSLSSPVAPDMQCDCEEHDE